ncbi:MAG: hypothetical protein JWR63_1891 [Conexibacter sp.]|nr:hypothetical protein [Conexibacter sp.]
MPSLADRAAIADREWAESLGIPPLHRDDWSLRHAYTIVYCVTSAVAHSTLAGLQFVTDRRADDITIDVEPRGRAHEVIIPLPDGSR